MNPRDLLLLGLTASLPAQSSFTLPNGYESRPGDSAVTAAQPWGGPSATLQYIDHGQTGAPRVGIFAVELRRDELATTGSMARMSEVHVVLGHAVPEASIGTGFQQNYLGLQRTEVLAATLALPTTVPFQQSWGQIRFPFTQPFTYDPAIGGLVIEFQCRNTTPFGLYSLDCTDRTAAGVGTFAYLDAGDRCFTQNGGMDLDQEAPSTDPQGLVTVDSHALRAPANAPSVLIWGLESATPTPLLCATLRATPEIAAFPLVANLAGSIGSASMPNRVTFPFPGTDFSLVAQYASLDPSRAPIPGVLSDAARFSVVGPQHRNPVWNLSDAAFRAAIGSLSPRHVPVMRFLLP